MDNNNDLLEQFYSLRDEIIEKRYEHLDASQIKAVLSENKNSIVVACPGAGKTQVIINRVDYLCTFGTVYKDRHANNNITMKDIEQLKAYINGKDENLPMVIRQQGINKNNIIILTFTKAAALNMKNRYKKLFNSKEEPFFGTFHGLFYKILKNYKGNINLIQSYETYSIIKKVLEQYMDEINEDKLKEVVNDISKYKCSLEKELQFEPSVEKAIFIEIYTEYEQYKNKKALMDFDDLQLQCLELFKENKKIREGYSNLFKYMLIDEFQDSDSLQLNILKLLNKNSSIFAVGDEDQCIYGFRGSKPDCMVNFSKIFGTGDKIFLKTNYRSTVNIVNISKQLIDKNAMRNKKEINSNRKDKGRLVILNCFNENEEAEQVSSTIIKEKEINGYDYRDFAILYRTNVESRSLIDSFIRKNIPFKLLDKEYNFFEHFICKDIISYLKLAIDSTDKESFLRIINKPFRYISKLNLEKIKSYRYSENLFEVLKRIDEIPVFQMKTIENLRKDIGKLNKMSLQAALQYIISDIGYIEYINEYAKKYKYAVDELLEIVEEFKEAALQYKSIITFLAHVREVSETLKVNKKEHTKDSVILSTIHGVKGMEFKNVFIINCLEETIPHKNSIEHNLEEERRLFYVGITRAKDNLWLGIGNEVRGKAKEPSRFITECNLEINKNYYSDFKVFDTINHKSFGKGKITYLDKNTMEIEFEKGIRRRFDTVILGNNGLVRKVE